MSVRTGPELAGREGATTDQTSRSAYQQEEAGEHSASSGDSPRRLFQYDNDAEMRRKATLYPVFRGWVVPLCI